MGGSKELSSGGSGPDADDSEVLDLAGQVRPPTIDLPSGYRYGVTRHADVILQGAFPNRLDDLKHVLERFRPTLDELRAGGGGRTVFVKRFDDSLNARLEDDQQVWGKQNITIEKRLGLDGDTKLVSRVRGHEIDMFGFGSTVEPLPGIAVEMEWNNKDPFFDRDLINFQALHHEGAVAVGVIVTRGPDLQSLLQGVIQSKDGGIKFGPSSTHWDKLVPRVNLGGGGECPLLLIGIEPSRIEGVQLAYEVRAILDKAKATVDKNEWRKNFNTYRDAQAEARRLKKEARALMPPVVDEEPEE